ncbi:IclR family transcriptional regulator [Sinobaca sp. H24]|uniref:IclR family transcriptional regulator n=1 Tax=Sinobaca sp. H24 TaxID=2923376 RepID=UPI00207A9FFD|nr:IclR family transcriptional regulator [Sinobaca sp. H24]
MSSRLDVRATASPILEALSKKTKETVHLVTMDEGEVVYIDKKESEAVIRMFSQIGKRAPVHCTGVGKAMLAFYPEKQIEDILDKHPMEKFTANTITTKEKMILHLAEIRKKGWALDDEEHEEGIKCAAAPIFNRMGEVEAAISIAVPMMRVKNKEFEMYISEIKTASQDISKAMGSQLTS